MGSPNKASIETEVNNLENSRRERLNQFLKEILLEISNFVSDMIIVYLSKPICKYNHIHTTYVKKNTIKGIVNNAAMKRFCG